jgi:hypothetical protein
MFVSGLAVSTPAAHAESTSPPHFELLGRYTTGLAGPGQTAGETAAVRFGQLYVTNASDRSLDIVNVINPKRPRLQKRVDLSRFGESVTSVAVSLTGLVAVAVERGTDPGVVVLLDPAGKVLRSVTVGALPDMVTFTPDGRRLLVANEGQPNCYNAPDCVDPPGSVSIVTVVPWLPERPVQTVDFDAVALPHDVRIFGPNATVAQDLEPEYITVSADNRTAYVSLQENNAIAVIDIASASVREIRSLGYKNFAQAPDVDVFELSDLPPIGNTEAGQTLELGGFSGLFFEGLGEDGRLRFVANTDRGPNGEPVGVDRPFLLPDFTPRIVRLELDRETRTVEITQQILLRDKDGKPISGLPNTAIAGGTGNTPYNDEVPVDLFGRTLPLDPLGGDYEGVVVDRDGSFWLPDEYRPALYHFGPDGVLIARYVPVGTHAAAGVESPAPGSAGRFGIEALPAVLGQRRQNRGFEAIALQNDRIYVFVQSPIRNPATLSNATLNALRNIRIVEFDPGTLTTRQFLYVMDNPVSTGPDDTRADKIGDATALPGLGFLVIERDDDATPEDPTATITKKIYAFDIAGATDISARDTLYDLGGVLKSLDQMTPAELASNAVRVTPVAKVLHVDLATAGYDAVEKVEGLAVIDANTLAVVNDNDFGVAQIIIDNTTGTFELAPGYEPEPVLLGLIQTRGFDASDRDNVINIRDWPVYGMYQPDAIATYKSHGRRLLISANEGDARDYPGFNEEARGRDIRTLYPAIPELNDNLALGRLTLTRSPPMDDFTQPYVFGTRSFSIWDAETGEQLWDSASELEVIMATLLPNHFNSNNDESNFDNRSDNKGPEPEGVDVGRIGSRHYAFVGLERIGGVVVYDVTDPTAPEFVQYVNDRDFGLSPPGPDSGPEVVRFVSALENPTGKPLLVVANEVTGTVSLYGLANAKPWWQRWRWAWKTQH